MPAGEAAVGHGHRHRRVRDVSDERRVEGGDVRGALGRLVDVAGAPRRAVGVYREGAVEHAAATGRRWRGRGRVEPDLPDRRGMVVEPRDDRRQVAGRLEGRERELAGFPFGGRRHRGVRAGWRPAGDHAPSGGDREVEGRRGVVGDQRLRVPVAAVAVDVAGLAEPEQRLELEQHALPPDPVLVEVLRREDALVGHGHRELGAPGDLLGQVDHEVVPSVHPEEEQGAELGGGDRPHRELVGETQAERRDRQPLHPRREAGGAGDAALGELAPGPRPLLGEAQGLERRVDLVVEDIERHRVVVSEIASPGRPLPGGRVQRDDAVGFPLEQRDVLRLPERLRVGQGAVVLGADLGEEIAAARRERPDPVADVRQIEGERQRHELFEHRLGVAQRAPVHAPRPQRARRHLGPVRVRVQADEGRLELRLEHLAPAEYLHLPALRLGLRGETHDAVAEEHEAGDPVVGLRHERGTLGQGQGQVFTGDDQVVGRVLRRGGDAQMAQVVDRVDGVLLEDAPCPARAVADDVEPPRLQPAARARLEEQLEHQPIAGALGMAVERGLEARRRGDPVDAGPHVLGREPRGRIAVGRRRRQGDVRARIAGQHRRFQGFDERFVAGGRPGAVGRRLRAAWMREQEQEPRRAEQSTGVHGWFTPRPILYPNGAGEPAGRVGLGRMHRRSTALRPEGRSTWSAGRRRGGRTDRSMRSGPGPGGHAWGRDRGDMLPGIRCRAAAQTGRCAPGPGRAATALGPRSR